MLLNEATEELVAKRIKASPPPGHLPGPPARPLTHSAHRALSLFCPQVPPGREQYFYLLSVSQTANIVGGVLLSVIYLLAKFTDVRARAWLGADLNSVSLLIVASFVTSLRTQVRSMLMLDGVRDDASRRLAPLRLYGPVATST